MSPELQSLNGSREAGPEVDVRLVGHGRLLLATEFAEDAIRQLGTAVQRLLDEDPSDHCKDIIQMLRLQKDLNRLLIDVGIAQVRLGRDPEAESITGPAMTPFPAGKPLEMAR